MYANEKDILFTAREMVLSEHRCSCRQVRPQAEIVGKYAVVRCSCGFVTSFEVRTVMNVQRRVAAANDNDSLVDTVKRILEPPQRPELPQRKPRFSTAA